MEMVSSLHKPLLRAGKPEIPSGCCSRLLQPSQLESVFILKGFYPGDLVCFSISLGTPLPSAARLAPRLAEPGTQTAELCLTKRPGACRDTKRPGACRDNRSP